MSKDRARHKETNGRSWVSQAKDDLASGCRWKSKEGKGGKGCKLGFGFTAKQTNFTHLANSKRGLIVPAVGTTETSKRYTLGYTRLKLS